MCYLRPYLLLLCTVLLPATEARQPLARKVHPIAHTLQHAGLGKVIGKIERGKKVTFNPVLAFRLAMREPIHGLAATRRLAYHYRNNPLPQEVRHEIMLQALEEGSPEVVGYLLKHGIYDYPFLRGIATHQTFHQHFALGWPTLPLPRLWQELITMPTPPLVGYIAYFLYVQEFLAFVVNIGSALVVTLPLTHQRNHPWFYTLKYWLNYSPQQGMLHALGYRAEAQAKLRTTFLWNILALPLLGMLNMISPYLINWCFLSMQVTALSNRPSYLLHLIISNKRTPQEKATLTKLLLRHGANPHEHYLYTSPVKMDPQTPMEIIQVLNLQQYNSYNLLALAAMQDLLGVAEALLHHGADPNSRTVQGEDMPPTMEQGELPIPWTRYVPLAALYYQAPHPQLRYFTPLDFASEGSKTYEYLQAQSAKHSQASETASDTGASK